jgi:hypothetical protein
MFFGPVHFAQGLEFQNHATFGKLLYTFVVPAYVGMDSDRICMDTNLDVTIYQHFILNSEANTIEYEYK